MLPVGAFFLSNDGVRRGGLLTSVLSWVFCAEEAVGRIMRARKPPLTGWVVVLSLDEGREAVEVRLATGAVAVAGLLEKPLTIEGRAWRCVVDGRLGAGAAAAAAGLLEVWLDSCRAAEAAVGAVNRDGTLAVVLGAGAGFGAAAVGSVAGSLTFACEAAVELVKEALLGLRVAGLGESVD